MIFHTKERGKKGVANYRLRKRESMAGLRCTKCWKPKEDALYVSTCRQIFEIPTGPVAPIHCKATKLKEIQNGLQNARRESRLKCHPALLEGASACEPIIKWVRTRYYKNAAKFWSYVDGLLGWVGIASHRMEFTSTTIWPISSEYYSAGQKQENLKRQKPTRCFE